MLAGFQQYGLQPGPLLFATNPQLVWGLIASLFIANLMLLVLNLPLIGLWVKLLTIPKPWLMPAFCCLRRSAPSAPIHRSSNSACCSPSVSSAISCASSAIRSRRRRRPHPRPLAEQQLRRALAIGQGDPSVLFTSPIAVGLFLVAAAAFIVPLIMRIRGRGQVLTQLAANED